MDRPEGASMDMIYDTMPLVESQVDDWPICLSVYPGKNLINGWFSAVSRQ
jgi:hypothetical protein